MGKGKGMVDHWYARVKGERVIFEVSGVPKEVAQAIFKVAGSKLPVKTRLVEKAVTPVATPAPAAAPKPVTAGHPGSPLAPGVPAPPTAQNSQQKRA